MALVDDREAPDYVPTTNELDKIPDEVPPGTPTEIRLGQAVLMSMVNPPEAGSYIDISARLYIKHSGFDQNTPDSPKVPVRLSKIIVAWPMGEKMPPPPEKPAKKTKAQEEAEAAAAAADDQPPLFEDDGEPELLGDAVDELLGEELADAADDTEFEGGPAFSDGGE